MQIGIFAKTFTGSDPLTVLRAAATAGYGAVQYNMACSGLGALPASIAPSDAAAIRAAAATTGVAIAAVSATYNMIHPDPAVVEAGRRAFAAIAEAAPKMGTRLVTVCTGSRDPVDQWRHHPDNTEASAWRDLLAEVERLLVIAERHDVLIGVEPELANVVHSAGAAARLLSTFPGARIRIVLDPANLFETADAPTRRALIEEAINLLHPAIAMVHAKDRHADGSFAAAGAGVIDFRHFFATLRQAGFAGPVITHGLTAEEAPGVATVLADAIARSAA